MQKFPAGNDCHSAVNLEDADLFPRIQTAAASEAAAGVLLWGVLPSEDEKDSGSSTLVLHSRVQAHLGPPQDDLSTGSWLDRGDPLQGSTSDLATDEDSPPECRSCSPVGCTSLRSRINDPRTVLPQQEFPESQKPCCFLHYGILTVRTVPGT